MPNSTASLPAPRYRVFIDFDNTISRGDVLDRIIERFAVDGKWRELEDEWAAGRSSARACLDGQLRTLRGHWSEFERFLEGVELDPGFAQLRDVLRAEKVDLVILSDNFDRFIEAVLRRCGYRDVPFFANHVEFVGERLLPSFPFYNPDCPGCAHCKKTHFVPRPDARRIVYIGDGRSDICPAMQADIVFAKSSLLSYLKEAQHPYRGFADLAEVAGELPKLFHEYHP